MTAQTDCQHVWYHSASYGGELCSVCGKPKGFKKQVRIDADELAALREDAGTLMAMATVLGQRTAELAAARAECEAMRADAKRYQWIRQHWKTVKFRFARRTGRLTGFSMTVSAICNNDSSTYINQEIDAAIAVEGEKE